MFVDLVISQYESNTDWTKGLNYDRVLTYSKSSTPPEFSIKLLNFGKNLHSYLYHIVSQYNNLADWTVFSPDNPEDHMDGVDFNLLLEPRDNIVCPWLYRSIDWDAHGRFPWNSWDNRLSGTGESYASRYELGIITHCKENIFDWAMRMDSLDVKHFYLGYHPGAIYGIPKSLILSRPQQVYQAFLEELGHSLDSEEAHYLERIWPMIFDDKIGDLKASFGTKTLDQVQYEQTKNSLTEDFREARDSRKVGDSEGIIRGAKLKTSSSVPKPKVRQREVIYLCQPSYGPGNGGSRRQFWGRCIHPDDPYSEMLTERSDYGSSLLADAFNSHWRTALNLQLKGINVTRFAMLHDDVVPENNWLGKLLGILDETGAGLISCVIPIKDDRGLSSTGINDPNDDWEVWRRITMDEALELPETFTKEDCFEKGLSESLNQFLLVNTGCWVADFTKDWRFKVHFEIKNRIIFTLTEDWKSPTRVNCDGDSYTVNLATGAVINNTDYLPGMKGEFGNQVWPEDWNFSRMLGELGVDVRATLAIKLNHVGHCNFNNWDKDWGNQKDDHNFRRKFDPKGLIAKREKEEKELEYKNTSKVENNGYQDKEVINV